MLKKAKISLIASIVVLLTLVRYPPMGIYTSNQLVYYLQGLRKAGVAYLKHDIEASSPSYHVVFVNIVYLLQKMNILARGSQLLAALLIVLFGLGIFLITLYLVRAWHSAPGSIADPSQSGGFSNRDIALSGIIVMLYFLVIERNAFTSVEAMANFTSISDYFQPSSLSHLIFLGIGLLLFRKWWGATIIFALVGITHQNYLFLSVFIVLIMLVQLHQEKNHKLLLRLMVFYGLVNLPFFIVATLQWLSVNGSQGIGVLVNFRSPQHAIIQNWWTSEQLLKLAVIAVAALITVFKFPKILRKIMLVYLAFIILGLFIDLLGNDQVAMIAPWRSTTFIIPVSVLIILSYLILLLTTPFEDSLVNVAFVLVSILSVFVIIQAKPWRFPAPYREYSTPEIRMVQANTTEDDVILIPPRMDQRFRVYAGRALLVDFKAHGYNNVEWYQRILFADEFLISDFNTQMDKCQDYHFQYYLLPIDAPAAEDAPPIASTDNYLLVACP